MDELLTKKQELQGKIEAAKIKVVAPPTPPKPSKVSSTEPPAVVRPPVAPRPPVVSPRDQDQSRGATAQNDINDLLNRPIGNREGAGVRNNDVLYALGDDLGSGSDVQDLADLMDRAKAKAKAKAAKASPKVESSVPKVSAPDKRTTSSEESGRRPEVSPQTLRDQDQLKGEAAQNAINDLLNRPLGNSEKARVENQSTETSAVMFALGDGSDRENDAIYTKELEKLHKDLDKLENEKTNYEGKELSAWQKFKLNRLEKQLKAKAEKIAKAEADYMKKHIGELPKDTDFTKNKIVLKETPGYVKKTDADGRPYYERTQKEVMNQAKLVADLDGISDKDLKDGNLSMKEAVVNFLDDKTQKKEEFKDPNKTTPYISSEKVQDATAHKDVAYMKAMGEIYSKLLQNSTIDEARESLNKDLTDALSNNPSLKRMFSKESIARMNKSETIKKSELKNMYDTVYDAKITLFSQKYGVPKANFTKPDLKLITNDMLETASISSVIGVDEDNMVIDRDIKLRLPEVMTPDKMKIILNAFIHELTHYEQAQIANRDRIDVPNYEKNMYLIKTENYFFPGKEAVKKYREDRKNNKVSENPQMEYYLKQILEKEATETGKIISEKIVENLNK